jgi:ABC-type nitrate/sulfonate/bicarbonate transport system substrate-binding protein
MVAVLALVASACGGDDEETATTAGSETTAGGTETTAAAMEMVSIKGASMPNATGFPIWLAKDLGFLADNGLDLEIVYFQSGAPMVEAGVQGNAWQVGWIGSPPGMTAAEKWGLILAGMEIEEGRQLGVWVRTAELGDQDPAEFLVGADVMVPVNSTLDQTLGACLDFFGLTRDDINVVPLGPDDIDATFAAGQADAAAPFLRPGSPWVEDPDSYTMVCNAEMAGVSIYDPFIVHPNYWESNPEQSAAYIDAVYKANEWILANRDAAVDKMAEFYVEIGTDASRAAVEADVDARTWYTLDSAIEAYESGEALAGYNALAEFFVSVGNWESVPDIQPAVDAGLEVLKAAKEYRGSS